MISEPLARALTQYVLGDEGWPHPDGRPLWNYFYRMPTERGIREFHQIYQLPEGMRPGDLIERMGRE